MRPSQKPQPSSTASTDIKPTLPQVQVQPTPVDWSGRSRRFLNEGELEILITLVASVHPRTVIEFGCNIGRTAAALLEYVPGIERYVGIDVPFGFVTAKPVQRKEVPRLPGCEAEHDPRFELLLPEQGSQQLQGVDLPDCDAVFIDGDHSYEGVAHDTLLAMDRLRAGGIVVWHDHNDLGTVDVAQYLHEQAAAGWDLRHVRDTWLVYMLV